MSKDKRIRIRGILKMKRRKAEGGTCKYKEKEKMAQCKRLSGDHSTQQSQWTLKAVKKHIKFSEYFLQTIASEGGGRGEVRANLAIRPH